jgi:hypothetical protein
VLILRHDVDQAPRAALAMLAIERQEGVRATWYFRWRTASPDVIEAVRESGGGVGLHYETLTRMVLERGLQRSDAGRLIPEARETLRAEISAFRDRFGPIRSVCPHGDTRVPGVRNGDLLAGEEIAEYGVEFDGNAALAGHRLGHWLTDRLSTDGRWAGGASPTALLGDGVSPILCVLHPNNWASGTALWRDRLARGIASRRGLGPALSRTPTDVPRWG